MLLSQFLANLWGECENIEVKSMEIIEFLPLSTIQYCIHKDKTPIKLKFLEKKMEKKLIPN